MALKIRLARAGAKKRPFYRIVVAEATAPRDGRFVEKIGTYNPMLPKDQTRVVLDLERAKHWLSVGAQPTDRVERFLVEAKLLKAVTTSGQNLQKGQPKKKAQERMKEAADRAAAAASAE